MSDNSAYGGYLPSVCLGVDSSGKYTDQFNFGNYQYFNNGVFYRGIAGSNPVNIGSFNPFASGEYATIKIQVQDGYASIYINNKNVAQCALEDNKAALEILAYGGGDCYIRNLKVTLDQ